MSEEPRKAGLVGMEPCGRGMEERRSLRAPVGSGGPELNSKEIGSSLLRPTSRGALVNVTIWTGGRSGGRVQTRADLRSFPCAHAECADVPVDADTHRSGLTHLGCTHAAFAAPARPLRPHGHALTPWQTRYPGPPRARRQAIQEATGNSYSARAPQTWSGYCAGRARGRVGEHHGQWGGGVSTLPRLALPSRRRRLCPEVSNGIFHFVEKPRVGRGGRGSGPKIQPLAGPPAPCLDISLMLEGDSWSCESHHSCCLLQGNFTSYLLTSPCSSPGPALTTQAHVPPHIRDCAKQGHVEAPLMSRFLFLSASLCPPGCSPNMCGCPNHVLLGLVVTPSGRPLPGARVSLRDWPGTVATSDAHGSFQMPGVCAGSQANVSAQMDGFSAGMAQAQANSSISAVVTIVLDKLGKCLVVKGVGGPRNWLGSSG